MYSNAYPPAIVAGLAFIFIPFVMLAGGGLKEIYPLICLVTFLLTISFIIQCYYAIANGDRSVFEK